MGIEQFKTLLTLDIDGEVYGFTSGEHISLSRDSDSRMIQFVPGLVSISVPSRTIDPLSNSISDGSSSVRLSLKELPALKSIMSGARIFRSRGVVYCWTGERFLSDAIVGYSGIVRNPTITPSSGEVELVLEVDSQGVNTRFPVGLIGDEGRFINPAENSLDEPMPIVYGRVQKMAIPTLLLDNETGVVRMCLAGHSVVGDPAQSGYVRVGTDESGDGETFYEIKSAVDGLGSSYSYIEISYEVWDDSIYVVDMIGKPNPGSSGGIRKLGDVLLDVWKAESGMSIDAIDSQRIAFANERLNTYDIGVGLNETSEGQTLFDIFNGRFTGQFPVVFGSPNGKYGWDCTDLPASDAPPISRIIHGQNAFDRGAVSFGAADGVVNRFTISYGVNGQTEQNENSITLNADTSELCRYSQSLFGKSVESALNAPDVTSEVTAGRILQSSARRRALPRISVRYSSVGAEYLDYPLMSVVEVTDEDIGWERKRFVLTEVTPLLDVGMVEVSLVSLDSFYY